MINDPVGFWFLEPTIVAVLTLLTNTLKLLKRSSENLLAVFFGPEMQNLFLIQPMGRNMVSKVPSNMVERLQLDTPSGYTFHSYRGSAATAVADAGATSEGLFWMV